MKLLPCAVKRIDNSANNGEILLFFGSMIAIITSVYNYGIIHLRTNKINKTIPWEVDLKLI